MKPAKDKKYKIELQNGNVQLTRGRMGAVLIEKKLHFWILDSNYEDLGTNLVYGWKGYQSYSDDELITEVQESFSFPHEIRELLAIQDMRLKVYNARNKREGRELLKEINEEQKKKF